MKKQVRGWLVPLLACLSACTSAPPLQGNTDLPAEPSVDAGDDGDWLGPILERNDEPTKDASVASAWAVQNDAEAPQRPTDLWGARVVGDVAQLAYNREGVAPCHVTLAGAVRCKGDNWATAASAGSTARRSAWRAGAPCRGSSA